MDELRVSFPSTASVVRFHPALALILLVAVCAAATACGGSPTAPNPPVSGPQISCPANVTVRLAGASEAVSFPPPTTTGGQAPVNVSCAPASGSVFAAGVTPVTCSATDGAARVATCGFSVILETIPRLSVSKFLAYGDSITEGQNGTLVFGHSTIDIIDGPNAYPTKLQALFDAAYPGQGILVVNEGLGGEAITDANLRLPDVLVRDQPGAMLIIDGYNDLLGACGFETGDTPACDTAIERVAGGLRDSVRIAHRYGASYVFVGTLTPPGTFSGPRDRRIAPGAITKVNAKIRLQIPGEGAVVVDLYPLFLGHETTYIASDGLHLLPPGNQAIADAFFAAIQAVVPKATPTGLR